MATKPESPAFVECDASIAKVQTMQDFGVRLTVDLPEAAVRLMATLAAWRGETVRIRVTREVAHD
jgi:hypothetical protein